MVRLFELTYLAGTLLVAVALAVAVAAVTRDDLPLVGTGAGALIAVALVGMAGCAVGGISQASVQGWTSPAIVLGVVLGLLALLIVAAGLGGWDTVLQPVAAIVPGDASGRSPLQLAIYGLGLLILVKWFVATGMAVVAR